MSLGIVTAPIEVFSGPANSLGNVIWPAVYKKYGSLRQALDLHEQHEE